MKIAFDHQIFQAQKYGGVSRYFVNLANKLISETNQVKIYAPFHQNIYLKDSKLCNNIYIKKILPGTDRLITFLNNKIVQSKLTNWKPDIIHQTYYSSYNSKLKFDFKPIIISTIHDMIHEKFPFYFPVNNRTIINKKKAIQNADHLICVSNSTKNDLIEIYNISESKISVVHHGFELNVDNNEVNNKLFIEKPFLLYVGNRDGYKNFNFFINSISKSRKLMSDFDIIAFGGGAFNKQDFTTFHKLGFRDNQIIQITASDSTLNALYQKASAFVYPSLYEGFGLPPLEAMTNSCPVIASNTSSIPEVIGDAGLYFDPNIPEQLIDSIEIVVYSELNRNKLIDLGRERIKLFSWNQCAKKTEEVYTKLHLNS